MIAQAQALILQFATPCCFVLCRYGDTRGRQGVTYRQSGTAMPPRSTFAGSSKVLAAVLKKYALVADFVEYPEPTNKKTKVKLDVAKIMKSESLFADLLVLQPNMAFQKKKNRQGSRGGVA